VVVIGLARQGKAVARYLSGQGAEVVVNDRKPATELEQAQRELQGLPLTFVFGGHPASLLEGTDIICLSGGVPADLPLAVEALRRGLLVSNDSQILLESCPATTLGITGSSGKSTTTALLGEMAQADPGRKAWVGGNIGRPLLSDLPGMRADDLVIVELSSFQLEVMTLSPRIAAVLNVTPNHLDRHGTMQAYTAAKRRILAFQTSADVAILGHEDPGAWALRPEVQGGLVSFGRAEPPEGKGVYLSDTTITWLDGGKSQELADLHSMKLRGQHNVLNALAASALAKVAGVPTLAIRAGLEAFTGLPHRLELVRELNGVRWYDDSIATAPERSLASLATFEDEPIVLLAGGRDKHLPWGDFAQTVSERVDHLILFGEAGPKIAEAMRSGTGHRLKSQDVLPSLELAVARASELAEPGDVVLLAPGGTSFDAFVDFEARGERFKQLVAAL
jgi:UDP-N-acetylmuramoylalanine--D-glutamate ligase